ncbi:hypothetical protein ACTXT7_017338 [Hymenolepis weldensis]
MSFERDSRNCSTELDEDCNSEPFRFPVGPGALKIPVERPMGSSTIRIKLDDGAYKDPLEVVIDMLFTSSSETRSSIGKGMLKCTNNVTR